MAFGFKCPVQKLAFEKSEGTFSSSEKYKKIVLEHCFNHSVRSSLPVNDNTTLRLALFDEP